MKPFFVHNIISATTYFNILITYENFQILTASHSRNYDAILSVTKIGLCRNKWIWDIGCPWLLLIIIAKHKDIENCFRETTTGILELLKGVSVIHGMKTL